MILLSRLWNSGELYALDLVDEKNNENSWHSGLWKNCFKCSDDSEEAKCEVNRNSSTAFMQISYWALYFPFIKTLQFREYYVNEKKN